MHYYQLIYTASESGLTGLPGFGIRSVSEDFPKEFLPLITGKMTSYRCGSFENISGPRLAEDPERIREYPKTYFYSVDKLQSGKTVSFLGRMVSIGFDYPFFKTGNSSTRTGNYLVHIFVFENTPDTAVFDLLFEAPLQGNHYFLPADFLPTTDNEELKSMLLGPAVPIPVSEKAFVSAVQGVPKESIDLLFDLVSALGEGKKLVVKMDAGKAPSACAGLMRVLPEKYAQEMTFSVNHQEEGISPGTWLTFINQYYQYAAPIGNVKVVDELTAPHHATSLERKWRAEIEKRVRESDLNGTKTICSWLLNKLSTKLVDHSDDLNWSLLRYLYIPEEFTLSEIVEVDGLLPLLSKIISADSSKSSLLMNLLAREYSEAQDISDISLLITVSEQVAAAGIPMGAVYEKARETVTNFVMTSPSRLKDVLNVHAVPVLKRYLDLSKTVEHKEFLSSDLLLDGWEKVYSIFYQPPFPAEELMVRMQSLYLKTSQIQVVLSEICPNAFDRVKMYVNRLKVHPEELPVYEPLLVWDKREADRVDYIKEWGCFFDREEFAPYFLTTIEFRKEEMPPVGLLKVCREISDRNVCFKELLLSNTSIYDTLFKRTILFIRGQSAGALDISIEDDVLPLIDEKNPAKKDWSNLRDVISLLVPESGWPQACYGLAVLIRSSEYLRKISPRGFEHFEALNDITAFVDALYDISDFRMDEMLESVRAIRSSKVRSFYIVAVARKKDVAFDTVVAWTELLSIKNPEDFYSEYFKSEYRLYKFKSIFRRNRK